MKKMIVLMLLAATCAFGQDDALLKAIEGAQLLHSSMRDPDSFKIGRVVVIRDEKHGDAACYEYYSRNGFGGFNHSQAAYAPRRKGKYVLDADIDEGSTSAIATRCNRNALKSASDVTEQVKSALAK